MTRLMKFLEDNTKPKMTAQELAGKVGVHSSLVSLWRTGQRKPGAKQLKALSKVTGIPIAELL
jgi:transcriptional regulator with XRE-family HTH domain